MAKRTGQGRKGAVFAAGAAAAAVGAPASAATINVNSLLDTVVAGDGACTLREALNNANANADTTGGDCVAGAGTDTITFSVAGTILLTGGQLRITDSANVTGPGAGTLTVNANGASRVFYIYNNAALLNVTISGVTMTGGAVGQGAVSSKGENLTLSNVTLSGNTASAVSTTTTAGGSLTIQNSTITGNSGATGGAVYVEANTPLTITNSTLLGNSSTSRGGAVFARNVGATSITGSTINNNTSSFSGAGLFLYRITGPVTISSSQISGNTGVSRGGGMKLYQINGPVTITDTSITGNSATFGGGGLFLYKSTAGGVVTIQRSTISGNSATASGGGIFFYKTGSAITLSDSTISGNSAGAQGGGIYMEGPFGAGQALNITSTTLASNSATTAGGNLEGGTGANNITITNSIVAGGTAPTGPDIQSNAATVTMNFSLLQNVSGATLAGGSGNNITGVSPVLGPLANNGGPTQTMLPAAGSPVINAGTAAGAPATDQRGFARIVGPAPDMGSVEVAAAAGLGGVQAVPTLSQWALGLLAMLLGWLGMRRSPRA